MTEQEFMGYGWEQEFYINHQDENPTEGEQAAMQEEAEETAKAEAKAPKWKWFCGDDEDGWD